MIVQRGLDCSNISVSSGIVPALINDSGAEIFCIRGFEV
jgi:hypothetical protein